MHIKFLNRSTGTGEGLGRYLLSNKDSKGEVRARVEVLRGDLRMCARLIDSLEFVHRFTTGVISWHPHDKPTDDEINEVLDEFERVSFAGLEPEQYAWSVVLHADQDGSKHVHFVVPRVELTTGNSMNIAPARFRDATYDPLRDMLNLAKGWASPTDERLRRDSHPGPIGTFTPPVEGDDPHVFFGSWIKQLALAGEVSSRADVVAKFQELANAGHLEITRLGRDSISIRLPTKSKPSRLKGILFEENFDGVSYRRDQESSRRRPAGREAPNPNQAETVRAKLEPVVYARARYNRQRYPAPSGKRPLNAVREVRDVIPEAPAEQDPLHLEEPAIETEVSDSAVAGPANQVVLLKSEKKLSHVKKELNHDRDLKIARAAIEQSNGAIQRAVQRTREFREFIAEAVQRIRENSRRSGVASRKRSLDFVAAVGRIDVRLGKVVDELKPKEPVTQNASLPKHT